MWCAPTTRVCCIGDGNGPSGYCRHGEARSQWRRISSPVANDRKFAVVREQSYESGTITKLQIMARPQRARPPQRRRGVASGKIEQLVTATAGQAGLRLVAQRQAEQVR